MLLAFRKEPAFGGVGARLVVLRQHAPANQHRESYRAREDAVLRGPAPPDPLP